MTAPKPLPSLEQLNSTFLYDPDTGDIYRKPTAAGYTEARGYRVLEIEGVRYRAHRVIWKLVTGEEPPPIIDHIDRDPSNNAWGNLRGSDTSGNTHNSGLYKHNTSGFRGVHLDRGKYRSQIYIKNNRLDLGRYSTAEEANKVLEEFREFMLVKARLEK